MLADTVSNAMNENERENVKQNIVNDSISKCPKIPTNLMLNVFFLKKKPNKR